MNNKKPIVTVILFLCVLCTACTPSYKGLDKPLEGSQPDAEVISDGGRAARQGDWIYFINGDNFTRETERFSAYSGALCRMRTDGTDPAIIVNLDISIFNIAGEYIYFASYEDNTSYACRVKVDGTGFQRLQQIDDIYDGGCYDFGAGYFYYTKDYKLYRMNADGSNAVRLTSFKIYNLRVGNDYAYFTEQVDENFGSAYKIAHDSTDPVKITKSAAYVLDIQGSTAYYYMMDNGYAYAYDQNSGTAESIAHGSYEEYLFLPEEKILCASYVLEETGIYILPLGGDQEIAKISEDSASRMAYYDGFIYYIDQTSLSEMYRIRPDGTEHELVSDDYISDTDTLDIIDGWIYYFSEGDECRIYRLNTETLKAQCIQIEDIGVVGE